MPTVAHAGIGPADATLPVFGFPLLLGEPIGDYGYWLRDLQAFQRCVPLAP